MSTVQLNLARKWRSKNFDQIIGQDLSVRMLKNSLYLNHFFPVYLFSGQRGCGKTTTARVFAAAINCEQLIQFQQQPKEYNLPCQMCDSCQAMALNNHPDFIEIDAASHTGVDNVRSIIESASFMPILGRKKIYLIDEAHMLSKAAFNAFLKILEEPPLSVLFILATTDVHKVIETVRSRSFQLFFKRVNTISLRNHLEQICRTEGIEYEQSALSLIIKETDGSVRDAINLLEQVRFAYQSVNRTGVNEVLGHVADEVIISILNCMLKGSTSELIAIIQQHGNSPDQVVLIWNLLINLVRAVIRVYYDVDHDFIEYHDQLKKIVSTYPITRVMNILRLFFDYELVFHKTTDPVRLFELIVICACKIPDSNENNSSPLSMHQTNASIEDIPPMAESVYDEQEVSKHVENGVEWNMFIESIDALKDALLSSIFKNARFEHHVSSHKITLKFSTEYVFFKDWLETNQSAWLPLLKKYFGQEAMIDFAFVEISTPAVIIDKKKTITSTLPEKKKIPDQMVQSSHNSLPAAVSKNKFIPKPMYQKKLIVPKEKTLTLGAAHEWPIAHMLLHKFPGIITEYKEDNHEFVS